MRHLIYITLLVPLSAFATSPQTKQNTADIAALQDEQIIQDKRIRALELTDPVPGPQGADGAVGPQGPEGPEGPEGPPGGVLAGVSTEAAQIQMSLDLTSGLRWLVADHYGQNSFFAQDNATAGADPAISWSNKFVASATVIDGVIEIEFGADAAPAIQFGRVFLTPSDPGSAVVWFDCSGDGITDDYLAELDCVFSDKPHQPTFTIRSQIETGLDLLRQSNAQQLIQDFYNLNGYWPSDNFQAGLGVQTEYQNNYVTELVITGNGQITMIFGNEVNAGILGLPLEWIPTDNGSSIQWDCTSFIIPNKYLPYECRQ